MVIDVVFVAACRACSEIGKRVRKVLSAASKERARHPRGNHARPPAANSTRRRRAKLIPSRRRAVPKVVILYDAENIAQQFFGPVWKQASEEGSIRLARIYAPEAILESDAWENASALYDIERIATPGCKAGKNSSDIALAIDAMDLLATVDVDTFIIVSSDTDFAPVARRLRKNGKRVVGMGVEERNETYRAAFDAFVELSPFKRADGSVAIALPPAEPCERSGEGEDPAELGRHLAFISRQSWRSGIDEVALELAYRCARKCEKPDTWCYLARFSQLMQEEAPSFSTKHYGCKNMLAFVKKTGMFDIKCAEDVHRIRLRDR